jgi:ribosomal protein S18 acetylase RimI-like enzyme
VSSFYCIIIVYLRPMQVSILKANIEDIALLQSLIQLIWKPTYQDILSEAQMDYMLKMMYSSAVLEGQFNNGHKFLLIYKEETPVGFAGYEFNYANQEGVCKLHKIYLLPHTQGMNLGNRLFTEVKKLATEAHQSKLILNVNRYNKAFTFYQKLGMEIAEEVDVAIGNGYYMNDYVMSLDLK